jgi:selenocysteine lyase/cysteine desulfurase
MHGQIPFKISELHCDFMAGSPHKWAFAPAGCGLLYVREEHLDRLWPSIISGGWDKKELKAARFMNIGTNNRAVIEGMIAGLDFLKQLGPERVYARIHQLAGYTLRKAQAVPYIEPLTPGDDRLYGSLVGIRFKKPAEELEPFHAALRKQRVWVAGAPQVRLSSHVHTRREDIDLYFELMRQTLG